MWIGLRFPWQTDRKRFDSQGRQIQAETGQGGVSIDVENGQGDVSIYVENGQGDVSIYVENGQGKCFDS